MGKSFRLADLPKYYTFGLKNLEKTREKYETYEPRYNHFNQITPEDASTVLDYGVDFWCVYNANYFDYWYRGNQWNTNYTTKQRLKMLHTNINQWTWTYNQNAFKDIGFTESQAIKLATQFYIKNYEAVNKKMTEMFLEAITESTVFSKELRDEAEKLLNLMS